MEWTRFEDVFKVFHYPTGESCVELADTTILLDGDEGATIIAANVRSFEDLCNCVTAHRILERAGMPIQWFIPYFPFGRHDRRRTSMDGFELGLALEIAEELNPITLDPHSDVLGQMRSIPQYVVVDEFKRAGLERGLANPLYVIPDQGATKKAYYWIPSNHVQGLKHRDVTTGKLSGFGIMDHSIAGTDCIIVDDICDGGGTFLGLADVLLERKAKSLTLAVTHGLFTQGLEALSLKFDRIFTTGDNRSVKAQWTCTGGKLREVALINHETFLGKAVI